MFKKLLGIVLALTIALGACSAVFAEKGGSSRWSSAKAKREAKAEVGGLLDSLDYIAALLDDRHSLADIIVRIAAVYGEDIKNAEVMSALNKMEKGIGKSIEFMQNVQDRLANDLTYSEKDYQNSMDTAARSFLNVLDPKEIDETVEILYSLMQVKGVVELSAIFSTIRYIYDLLKRTQALSPDLAALAYA